MSLAFTDQRRAWRDGAFALSVAGRMSLRAGPTIPSQRIIGKKKNIGISLLHYVSSYGRLRSNVRVRGRVPPITRG
ncbi:MAG: hypothetical protein P8Y53_12660 [Pseudolabrys sp.]